MNYEQSVTRLRKFVAEGRIIRNDWSRTESGRELACLYAAMVPGATSTENCPACLMPQWLADMTPGIDDNVSADYWPEMVREYADLAGEWHALDAAAWRRVQCKTLRECLLIALPNDTAGVVQPVIDLIDRELSGDVPAGSEWAARAAEAAAARAAEAEAARAAEAWTAEAARAAAEAAWTAAAAARAAAAAARAAWTAAEAAAEAARAAWTAAEAAAEAAAARDRITRSLFAAIRQEVKP